MAEPMAEGERLVQEKWQERECIDTTAIVYGDGNLTLLSYSRAWDTESRLIVIEPKVTMQVVTFLHQSRVQWSDLYELCKAASPAIGICVRGGESSWGTIGFLAVSKLEEDRLIWLAIFEDSNPFVEVGIRESTILGISSYDDLYTFPFDAPERVTAQPGNRRGWDSRHPRLS